MFIRFKKNSLVFSFMALLFISLLTLTACAGNTGNQEKQSDQAAEENSPKEKIVIRLSHDKPAGGTMGIIPEKFKEFVDADESLKGMVEVQVYPGAQLYKAEEGLQAVMRGDVEMIFVGNNNLSSLSQSCSIFDLPFLFKDIKDVNAYVASPAIEEVYKPLEEKGMKYLVAGATGSYGILTKGVSVQKPEDVKNLRIRSLGDASLTFQELGASPINLAAGDVYIGLQRGTIDGADFGPISIVERKLYEVADNYCNIFTHSTVMSIMANKKFWDGLPADIQEKLMVNLKKAAKAHHEAVPALEDEYLEKMEQEGVKIYSPTEEEVNSWSEAVQGVYDKAGPKVGMELIEKVKSR